MILLEENSEVDPENLPESEGVSNLFTNFYLTLHSRLRQFLIKFHVPEVKLTLI